MAIAETAFVKIVAVPLAKFLFKQAFGDSVVVDIAGELLDTVTEVFGQGKKPKKVAEQFTAMSEGIAGNLYQLFRNEGEDANLEAVANELATTLNQLVDMRLLVDTNLDPKQLFNRLEGARPKQTIQLSSTDQNLYKRALQGLAPQLVAFAPQFEDFQVATEGEKLQRLANILTNLDQIINAPKVKARLYELRYLGAVNQCLDEMELFGAELEPGRKRHPLLSVAFVSLSLSEEGTNSNVDAESLFDTRIKRGSRLLILGEAGSGKSTLMRWLSLKAARYLLELEKPTNQRFLFEEERTESQYKDSWRQRVPFLLRLRDYPDGNLPVPNKFAPALETALDDPPEDWVKSLLDSGRSTVIFDGIDEVPTANRDNLQKEMEGYFRNYPNATFLLSARPAATEDWEPWLEQWGFSVLRINPMSNPEKESLVRQWHEAVRREMKRQNKKQSEIDAVSAKEKALLEKLFNEPNLSRMASYPLLCAVICALHNWKGAEPLKNYWRLCNDLCRLLINDRDIEAQVRLERFPEYYAKLDYEEKREIAQSIAMAMAEPEFKSSLSMGEAVKVTAPILAEVPGRKASEAAKVVKFMGERSGILRVPREGDVEFIHNIFKEFLITDSLLKEGRLNDLLDKVTDKDWKGVTVFAAASPNRRVATAIVSRLLEQGDWQSQLLALRCHTLAIYVDDALKPRVQNIAEGLFPPSNPEEAEAIAEMGNDVVLRLAFREGLTSQQANACVLALGHINTDKSRDAAKTFVYDERVLNELVRVINPLFIPQIMERIKETNWRPIEDWRHQIVDLTPLLDEQDLQSLNLSNTKVSDVSELAKLPQLQTLYLNETQVSDVSELAKLSQLQTLYLNNTQVSDVSELAKLPQLQSLNLSDTQVSDVSELAKLPQLQILNLSDTQVSDVSELAKLPQLRYLDLSNTKVSDVSELAKLPQLQDLELRNTQVSDVSELAKLSQLQTLDLSNTQVSDVSELAKLPQLRYLDLSATQVSDVSELAKLPQLQDLELRNTQVSDVSELAKLPQLQTLDLSNTQVSDVSELAKLPQLQILYLMDTQKGKVLGEELLNDKIRWW